MPIFFFFHVDSKRIPSITDGICGPLKSVKAGYNCINPLRNAKNDQTLSGIIDGLPSLAVPDESVKFMDISSHDSFELLFLNYFP